MSTLWTILTFLLVIQSIPAHADSAASCYSLFLDNPVSKYKVKEMDSSFWYDDMSDGVLYLKPADRDKFLMHTRNGLIVNSEGQVVDTGIYSYMFVMNEHGTIYIYRDIPTGVKGYFHHSTFLAGAPIAAAGNIKIVEGVAVKIDNRSGHYQPDFFYLEQAISELKEMGVDISQMDIYDKSTPVLVHKKPSLLKRLKARLSR